MYFKYGLILLKIYLESAGILTWLQLFHWFFKSTHSYVSWSSYGLLHNPSKLLNTCLGEESTYYIVGSNMHCTMLYNLKPQCCEVSFKFPYSFIFLTLYLSLLLSYFSFFKQKDEHTLWNSCTRHCFNSLPFPLPCYVSLSYPHLCLSQWPAAVSDKCSSLSYFHDWGSQIIKAI